MTLWRMRIAGWIPKASKVHSEYVVLIAPPLQQSLERKLLNVVLQVRCVSLALVVKEWIYGTVKHTSSFVIQHSIQPVDCNTNCAFTNFGHLSHLSCISNRRASFCMEIPSVSSYDACMNQQPVIKYVCYISDAVRQLTSLSYVTNDGVT